MEEKQEEVLLLNLWASPFAMSCAIALNLKGVAFSYVEEDIPYHKSELLLHSNPVYKEVPVLIHNGKPFSQSLVILEYIEEAWPSSTAAGNNSTHRAALLPGHPRLNALARFWAQFGNSKVLGSLQITNFNGVLVAKKCALCKGFKVSTLPEGGLCYPCGKVVEINEVVKLEREINQAGEVPVEVSLTGDAVDKVLRLEDTFLNLFHLDSMKVRISLSENTIEGSFLVDNQGQTIGFKSPPTNPN